MSKLITGPQLAKILGVTRAYIWRLSTRGDIPHKWYGGRFMYDEATVDRLQRDGLPRKRRKSRANSD